MILLPFIAIAAVGIWGFQPFKHLEAMDGVIEVEEGIHTVRIVAETGNIQILIGTAGKIEFAGKSLSVVELEEHVEALKSKPVTLVRDTENVPPGVLVLRVSKVPDGFRRIVAKGAPSGSARDPRPGVFRQVDIEVRVPVELNLELSAEETNLRVDTRQGSTSLEVENGNILVMHTSNVLRVRNGGGPTVIEQHRGSLDAEVEGQIRVTLAELTGEVKLTSKNGKVGLYLPAHSSFKVDATSEVAVRNAFSLKAEQTGPKMFRLDGEVRGGEHRIVLRAKGRPVTLALTEQ